MQLMDAATSALVKHQLLLDENCWKPMKGIHVEVLDVIGKFSRIQYSGNGIIAYAYNSDIKAVQKPSAIVKKVIVRSADKLKSVNNLINGKQVIFLKGKPTVALRFLAGNDSEIEISITKESLRSGLNLKIDNQQGGIMQASVSHKKEQSGLGAPDYVTFEILERNDEKKYLDVRVGGYWYEFRTNKSIDLEIKPVTIRISGAQFNETVRPHTAKELANPFK
jgi:hypothetical protein